MIDATKDERWKRKTEKETTMKKKQLRILCPNGHLGFAPTKEESFWLGAETKPDYYCCDSGSDDIGPGPLGSDTSVSPYAWEKHDLELMLLAARKQGVPMMIGSSGDTGTDSRVDMYVGMIKDLAKKHNMAPFKLVSFYSRTGQGLREEEDGQGRCRRGAGRPEEPDAGRTGSDRPDRGRGRRPSLHQGPGDGGGRHHRREKQRRRDLCRGGDL